MRKWDRLLLCAFDRLGASLRYLLGACAVALGHLNAMTLMSHWAMHTSSDSSIDQEQS